MPALSRRDFVAATAASALVPNWPLLHAEYDLVILHGRVIDPETKLDALRNVGVRGNRIVEVTTKEIKGRRTIDARGMVVSPGFIDPIAHGQDRENDRWQVFDGVTTKLQMEAGVADVNKWYSEQAGHRICNFGAGTGHGHARRAVLGDSEKAPSEAEIAAMQAFLDRNLRAGGLGVGFGLEYMPYSTRWEVFRMFETAGKYRASCHLHTRYGTLQEEQSNLTAIQEAMANGLACGAPVHIVHVPSMALSNTAQSLALIEAAQRQGLDVTCDFYPYTAFGTGISSEVFAEGWQTRFGINYGDLEWAQTHERLTAETFAKYQKQGGMVIAHAIPEAAVQAAVKSPATMVGSDGSLDKGVGHPRSTGTFARVLGHYSRDLKLIALPAAIRKMTLMPAKRFEGRSSEAKRKGRIQKGMDADITIFDPTKIIDRATFDHPDRTSAGVHYVVIQGTPVLWEEEAVEGATPGTGLRAGR